MSKKKPNSVWIIEDDSYFRKSLELLIESDDELKLSLSSNSVEQALISKKESGSPSVILQDIGLPGVSGIEAIHLFREEYPTVNIIMLTIFEDDEHVFGAIKAGANGYLLKQTPGEEILKGIKNVLEGGASISPGIAKKVLNTFSESGKKSDSPLTARETEILDLLVKGHTMDMISADLHISWHTVVSHIKNIYKKLQVHNRSGVVAKAIRDKLV